MKHYGPGLTILASFTTEFAYAVLVILGLSVHPLSSQGMASIDVASGEWADCTQKDGTGLYFDLLRMVYAEQGAMLNIKIVSFARSIQMLEGAKTDINIGDYEGEVSNGLYPKFPIDYDDLTVLMPSSKAGDFKGEASLKDGSWPGSSTTAMKST